MPTRDLNENKRRIDRKVERLDDIADRELIATYNRAMDDIRSRISRLYERFRGEGELTKAQAAQFLRQSNIEAEIQAIMGPYIRENQGLLTEASSVSFQESFYRNAWAVDQAAGVSQSWGLLNDNAVRAAIGLSDEGAALGGIMGQQELSKHMEVLNDAFRNYDSDTRRWIGRAVSDGVIKGESVDKLARRIRKDGLAHSYNSAKTIARTETLRARGVGSQLSYDEAANKGVRIQQIWDATLDSRTRPAHAQLDGATRSEESGMFDTPVGPVAGPQRSGVASFDINCRCTVRPEVEGYAPEVRRIRDEGIQPYQTFSDWARRQGLDRNRYGQRFDFLNE